MIRASRRGSLGLMFGDEFSMAASVSWRALTVDSTDSLSCATSFSKALARILSATDSLREMMSC
ncbi:MAG: hypothetical protein HC845_14230 [Akkermansiaceae bacterium]|nr:hypothetical protein [Akkermansiaceae bacterium]